MTQDPAAPAQPSELRARLVAAGPAEQVAILLGMIEAHPTGRLELPAGDGPPVLLDSIDLSPGALAGAVAGRGEPPPWWDPVRPGLRLRGADLRGVSLRKAVLKNVDLAEADLRDAVLGEADLTGALLERADLGGADLAGSVLEDAVLGGSNLRGAMLEEARMARAVMRFADLRGAALESADLRQADLWGVNLAGAILTRADLRGARMEEADARGAEFVGALLQQAKIRLTNFQGADLRDADLRGAALGGTDFTGASLKDARLQELDLSGCEIGHVYLSGARMDETRFSSEKLGGAIGEELTGAYADASRGYLALERNFTTLGDPDAASWAYRRRRRMQKLDALGRARSGWAARRRGPAARDLTQCACDQFVEWLCDYGESIPRILASLLALYLAFTLLYGLTGSVAREVGAPGGPVKVLTHRPLDLAIFSLLAMMTGPPEGVLKPRHDLALALVGVHVFLGIALIGLLGFVMGNRIRR